MNNTQSSLRQFRVAPLLLAVLCFFLPFLKFSCSLKPSDSSTKSGFELMTEDKGKLDDLGKAREDMAGKLEQASVLTVVAFGALIFAVFFSVMSLNWLAVIASLTSMAALFGMKLRVDSAFAKMTDTVQLLVVESGYGFVLCIGLLVVAVLWHAVLQMNRGAS